jgi:hypothetical protein
VPWSAGCDISELAGIVFSGLSSLVIEDVTDRDGVIVVRARTTGGPAPCPRCSGRTGGRDSLSWPHGDGLKWLHMDDASMAL